MKHFLMDEERIFLQKQHKKERDGRIRDRIKAVLLRDKGWTWMQIAEALLLSEEVLRLHLKEFQASRKLKPKMEVQKKNFLLNNRNNLSSIYYNIPICMQRIL